MCVMSVKVTQHENILENRTISQFIYFLGTCFPGALRAMGIFTYSLISLGVHGFHGLYFIDFYVFLLPYSVGNQSLAALFWGFW